MDTQCQLYLSFTLLCAQNHYKKGLKNKIDLMFFQVENPLHPGAQYYAVKRLKK